VIADDGLTLRGTQDGHQADGGRLVADCVPGNPNAVGRTEVRRTVVFREVFGRNYILAIGFDLIVLPRRVIIGVDDQFAFGFDRLVSCVVQEDASADPACRRLVRSEDRRFRPDGDHPFRTFTRSLVGFLVRRKQVPSRVLECIGAFAQRMTTAGGHDGPEQTDDPAANSISR